MRARKTGGMARIQGRRSQRTDKFQHFRLCLPEVDTRRNFLQSCPGQLAGNDKGNMRQELMDLEKEFFQVKATGDTGKVGIDKIGMFELAGKFKVF